MSILIPMEKSNNIWISLSTVSIGTLSLMLLFIIIFIVIACKRRRPSIKVDDIERPLITGDVGVVESRNIASPIDNFILDIPSTSEDYVSLITTNQSAEDQIYETGEDFINKSKHCARSTLLLEVISGPSRGICCSIDSTDTVRLPLIVGRVSPVDILLEDSEVSGKHANIDWDVNKLKWELVDMGSLNGTFLNSQAIHHHLSESRHWGNPVDLSTGDTITLGTSSNIFVQIKAQTECQNNA